MSSVLYIYAFSNKRHFQVVGILEYGLAKVADLMIKYVITPFLNGERPLSFLEELNHDSAYLKIVPSSDSKVNTMCQILRIYTAPCFANENSSINKLGMQKNGGAGLCILFGCALCLYKF